MTRTGDGGSPRISIDGGDLAATPEEAAAAIAAIERFVHDTAVESNGSTSSRDGAWLQAARYEAVGLDAKGPVRWQ